MSDEPYDDSAINFASFRPFVWISIVMAALWVVYFINFPAWAAWTVAIFLGLVTSFLLGLEVKAFQERRIARRERKQRNEIQEALDHAGHS